MNNLISKPTNPTNPSKLTNLIFLSAKRNELYIINDQGKYEITNPIIEMLRLKALDPKVMIQDHPIFSKYFKMLKVGLSVQAIKVKMLQAGLDSNMLDKDPTELILLSHDTTPIITPIKPTELIKVNLPKKKKLHWKPIETEKLKSTALWHEDVDNNEEIKLDEYELDNLFVTS